MVGTNYIILHSSHLAGKFETLEGAADLNPTVQAQIGWEPVICMTCDSHIGAVERASLAGADSGSFVGVKLWKHKISTSKRFPQLDFEDNFFKKNTLEAKLAVDLLETLQGLSCSRVVVCGLISGALFIQITILSMNTALEVIDAGSAVLKTNIDKMVPIIKLNYNNLLEPESSKQYAIYLFCN